MVSYFLNWLFKQKGWFVVLNEMIFKSLPTLLYMILIVYCLFLDKIQEPEDNYISIHCKFWINLEIRYFYTWILSNGFFLVYANIFKFQSMWKDTEDKLNITSVWQKKNSMDYLHYLKDEAANFSLLFSGLIVIAFDMFNNLQNESKAFNPIIGAFGWSYYIVNFVIRVLLIIGYLRNSQYDISMGSLFWKLYSVLVGVLLLVCILMFTLMLRSIEFTKQDDLPFLVIIQSL